MRRAHTGEEKTHTRTQGGMRLLFSIMRLVALVFMVVVSSSVDHAVGVGKHSSDD